MKPKLCECGHPHLRDVGGADGGCRDCDCAEFREPRRAYRYAVTETGGKDVGVKVGEHVVDWKWLGRVYCWRIMNFKTGETTSWFAGRYVDKGYEIAGKYVPDADLEATQEKAQSVC